ARSSPSIDGTREMVISSGHSPSPEPPSSPELQPARASAPTARRAGRDVVVRRMSEPFCRTGPGGRGSRPGGPGEDVVVEVGEGGPAQGRGAVGLADTYQSGVSAETLCGGEVVLPDVADGQSGSVGECGGNDRLQTGGLAHGAVHSRQRPGQVEHCQRPVDTQVGSVRGQDAAGPAGQLADEVGKS